MTRRPPPTVVLLSTPGALSGIDPLLRRAKIHLIRITSWEPRPVPPKTWMERLLRGPGPDTAVVTSRTAVRAGILPWLKASPKDPGSVEFWAVGPGTAAALREVGIRRVRRPSAVGSRAIAQDLGSHPSRTVVYFRSDWAGPELARALRRRGHRVTDLTVYRLVRPSPRSSGTLASLPSADLVVVSSPSGLAELKRRLGPAIFPRVSRTVRLVVLGRRSLETARAYGFRRVSVAPSTTAGRLTRFILRELARVDT